jgi:hypothetical protein
LVKRTEITNNQSKNHNGSSPKASQGISLLHMTIYQRTAGSINLKR